MRQAVALGLMIALLGAGAVRGDAPDRSPNPLPRAALAAAPATPPVLVPRPGAILPTIAPAPSPGVPAPAGLPATTAGPSAPGELPAKTAGPPAPAAQAATEGPSALAATTAGLPSPAVLAATTAGPPASVRPRARPAAVLVMPAQAAGMQDSPRPLPRPGGGPAGPAPAPEAEPAAAPAPGSTGIGALMRQGAAAAEPARRRPFEFLRRAAAVRTQPAPEAITGRRGALCGIAGIEGRSIPPIAGKLRGCGVADPVEVSVVDGVSLRPAAIMDCPTAAALKSWISTGLKPSIGQIGGGVGALQIAAHYVCRNRNNRAGGKISEHGKGKAIDISSVVLANGESITVADDWNRGRPGKALRRAHAAACGIFGTTLGPGSDGMHENHLHLDTASQRNGPYCK